MDIIIVLFSLFGHEHTRRNGQIMKTESQFSEKIGPNKLALFDGTPVLFLQGFAFSVHNMGVVVKRLLQQIRTFIYANEWQTSAGCYGTTVNISRSRWKKLLEMESPTDCYRSYLEVGLWLMLLAVVTFNMWRVTHYRFFCPFLSVFVVLVLVSAHVERFSVLCRTFSYESFLC